MEPAASASQRSYRIAGVACVAMGAMLFASKGIFAKTLYAQGVGFEALVAIRAVLALPLFVIFTVSREGSARVLATPRRAVLAAAFVGFLCYYVGAMLDFYALTLIDASIERVLLFSYPAMIVLFTSLRTHRWPEPRVLVAVGLTYFGIFLAVGGFDNREVRANAFGALLVIGSALTYAIYYLISERYTREIGSARFTLYAMGASTVALVVHFAVRGSLAQIAAIQAPSWVLLAVLAVFGMFVPALLQAEGVKRVGAQRGSVISTVGPPTTIGLAWLLLGEQMSVWQFAGTAAIVGGILILELARSARGDRR